MEEYVGKISEEEKFQSLKQFFELDLDIKGKIVELALSLRFVNDEDSKIEYLDSVYKTMDEFRKEFIDIFKSLGMEKNIDALNNFFNRFNEECVYKSNNPNALYRDLLSNMRMGFIEEVKGQTGYSYGGNLDLMISKSKTINELLHCIHSHIVNNGEILQSMPSINSKINTKDYPITLYGEDTELARKIFEEFPLELDVDETTIVSIEDKILMMVRGVGHELTIDIEPSVDGKYMVEYFVPKICNEEMVRSLKGINEDSITNNGAVGQFETTLEELTGELYDFISKVPDDFDMELDEDSPSTIKEDRGYQLEDNNNAAQETRNKTLKQKFFEWIMGTSLYNNKIIRKWVAKSLQKQLLSEGTENKITSTDNISKKTEAIPGIRKEDGKPYTIETPQIEQQKDTNTRSKGENENEI